METKLRLNLKTEHNIGEIEPMLKDMKLKSI
jgi:hypothetical protein